jgi:hypothetical protein
MAWLLSGSVIAWRTLRLADQRGIPGVRVGQAIVVLVASTIFLVFTTEKGFMVGEVINNTIRVHIGSAYALKLGESGKDLQFTGDVTYGLARRIEELTEAHPDIRQIELNSPGGSIAEAVAAAKSISGNRLATVVSRERCGRRSTRISRRSRRWAIRRVARRVAVRVCTLWRRCRFRRARQQS